MVKNTGFIAKARSLSKLGRAITTILTINLAVKRKESLLILFDQSHRTLADAFEKIASMYCNSVTLTKVIGHRRNGAEPPLAIARSIKSCDVCIILTSFSMSHTKARRDATARGVRIASMPGITEDILKRSISVDYDQMKSDTKIIADALDKAHTVRIKTALGTDLTVAINGRKAHGRKAGLYTKKGYWGNLPEGEAFIAPRDVDGVFVVDKSIAGIGKLSHPVIFFVEKGSIVKVTNGVTPVKVERYFRLGPKARVIAELGIGVNHKAKVTGTILEDEKAAGTCHIAFGNNMGFGGTNDVPLHIDCVIDKPSLWLDGKLLMRRGKLRKP